jgi:heme-degrading monooxygenase HmoA
VIARTWRGAVKREDAAAYAAYIDETGMKAYAATPGNQGAYMLTRELGELTEFTTLSFWDSVDAIRAFAGEDYETAVFYPEDDRYLVERDATCTHYEVASMARRD